MKESKWEKIKPWIVDGLGAVLLIVIGYGLMIIAFLAAAPPAPPGP